MQRSCSGINYDDDYSHTGHLPHAAQLLRHRLPQADAFISWNIILWLSLYHQLHILFCSKLPFAAQQL
jgi:hypothetical protein